MSENFKKIKSRLQTLLSPDSFFSMDDWQYRVWKGTIAILQGLTPSLLYLFIPSLVMSIGKMIRGYRGTTDQLMMESGNFYRFVGEMLVFYLLYRSAKKRNTTIFEDTTLYLKKPDKKLCGSCFILGACMGLFLSAVITLFPFRFLLFGYGEEAAKVFKGTDMILLFLSIGVIAPLMEEMLYRGYLLNRLLRTVREDTAVYVSSVIFAVCHVQPIWMIYSFFMGVLLAKLSIKKDNILYSVVLHAGFNFPSIVIRIFSDIGWEEKGFFSGFMVFLLGASSAAVGYKIWNKLKKEEMNSWISQ